MDSVRATGVFLADNACRRSCGRHTERGRRSRAEKWMNWCGRFRTEEYLCGGGIIKEGKGKKYVIKIHQ